MVLISTVSSLAQGIHVIARNTNDSIVLRWAPVSAANWTRYNAHGYKVERFTMDVSGVSGPVRLSPEPIIPWTLEAFQSTFPRDHKYAPPVAQALYGKQMMKGSDPSNPGAMMDAVNEQTMRWSVAMLFADYDANVANALGLRWVDRNLQPGAHYLYRVITLDPETPDTALVGVNRAMGADDIGQGPRIFPEENEGSIALRWAKNELTNPFSGYWIERSKVGGAWERLNKAPFIQTEPETDTPTELITYADTTIAGNYIPYRYRVIGMTPFGETTPTAPEVTAMGRDRTAPPNPIMKNVNDEKGKLVVRWEQPAGASDLKGFRVEKAPTGLGGHLPLHTGLLPTNARQFTDTSTYLLGENHFRVVAVDTAGNESVSMDGYGFLIDSIAPAPPTGLAGSVDTNGVVTVRWKLGREADILGYRVFFANAADHVFINQSPEPFADTVFTDTIQIKTLTKRIYYRVVAVDRNFNHSEFSTMLTLEKPDVIAPVAPVFSNYHATDSAVVLTFVPSSSLDVASHQLLRRSTIDTVWHSIADWPVSETRRSFTDTGISGLGFYAYTLQATDSSANKSPYAVPVEVRINRKVPTAGTIEVDVSSTDAGTVLVNWFASRKGVKHFVIYRSKDGAPMTSIASANVDINSYTDIRLQGKGLYRYAVKAVYENGSSSPMNESTDVTLLR